jgi:hypothetical protein
MSDDEPLPGPTYQQRVAARLQAEHAELDNPQVRAQMMLDRMWQMQRDAETSIDDEWDYSTGYAERRHKVTCHRGRWDPDF